MDGSAATRALRQYLTGAVDDAALTGFTGMGFNDLVEAAAVLEHAAEQLLALRSDVLRRADLAAVDGERVADRVYNSVRYNMSEAKTQVRVAKALDGYPIFRDAWRDGAISQDQLRAMLKGLGKVKLHLGPEQLEEVQLELLRYTETLDPKNLEEAAEDLASKLDPQAAHDAEKKRIEAAARRAERNRGVFFSKDDYSVRVRIEAPVDVGLIFLQQITSLMPSFESYKATGDVLPSVEARRMDGLEQWTAFFAKIDKTCLAKARRRLEEAQTNGSLLDEQDAQAAYTAQLLEILAVLPAIGGDRPQLLVTMSAQDYLAGGGQANLPGFGSKLSKRDTAITCCTAEVRSLIFGGQEPLSVGRKKRFFEQAIRQAIIARDEGCTFPGCEIPAILCDIHHILPWEQGGATDVTNGVLECKRHHRKIEPNPDLPADLQWQVYLDDETGYPIYIPPRDVDPDQRHLVNYRYLKKSPALQARFLKERPTPNDDAGAYGQAHPTDRRTPSETDRRTPSGTGGRALPGADGRSLPTDGERPLPRTDGKALPGSGGRALPGAGDEASPTGQDMSTLLLRRLAGLQEEQAAALAQRSGSSSPDSPAALVAAHLAAVQASHSSAPSSPGNSRAEQLAAHLAAGQAARSRDPFRDKASGQRPAPCISKHPLRPVEAPPLHDHDCKLDYNPDGTWHCQTQATEDRRAADEARYPDRNGWPWRGGGNQ